MKIHIVQKGDTLWKIAQKYDVDFEKLKQMNTHLSNPDMIMPGMKIKVPTEGVPVKKKEAQKKEEPVNPYTAKEKKEAPVKEKAKKETQVKETTEQEKPLPNMPKMPEMGKQTTNMSPKITQKLNSFDFDLNVPPYPVMPIGEIKEEEEADVELPKPKEPTDIAGVGEEIPNMPAVPQAPSPVGLPHPHAMPQPFPPAVAGVGQYGPCPPQMQAPFGGGYYSTPEVGGYGNCGCSPEPMVPGMGAYQNHSYPQAMGPEIGAYPSYGYPQVMGPEVGAYPSYGYPQVMGPEVGAYPSYGYSPQAMGPEMGGYPNYGYSQNPVPGAAQPQALSPAELGGYDDFDDDIPAVNVPGSGTAQPYNQYPGIENPYGTYPTVPQPYQQSPVMGAGYTPYRGGYAQPYPNAAFNPGFQQVQTGMYHGYRPVEAGYTSGYDCGCGGPSHVGQYGPLTTPPMGGYNPMQPNLPYGPYETSPYPPYGLPIEPEARNMDDYEEEEEDN